MVNRILQPQEIEVFYVIPAIRREFSRVLKEGGRSQKDIAKLLGVTEAAVSQYLTSKRAAALDLSDDLRADIRSCAKRIVSPIDITREVQRLLSVVRRSRVICEMHEKLGTTPKGCNVCFEDQLVNPK